MMTPSGGYRPLCLVVSCAWAMLGRAVAAVLGGVTEAVAMREMMTTTITIWMLSEAAVWLRFSSITIDFPKRTIFAYKSWTVIGVQSQAVIMIASKN
uniref:Secreted protein n=1 Tax=Oryza rufipogon TaxID=4529 RepID=A0A0E0NF00_ORYRU